jgi:3,4-dihydroxy 2-butanone 4-phosphate synthase/GTP cyclohydrolase II
MSKSVLTPLDQAIDAFARGTQVIIIDDEDRENEGDLVVAADFATSEAINFMTVHGRGLVCLAMQGSLIDRLQIPMMVPTAHNRSGFGTGFTVSVEAVRGVSTGISAPDRAETVRVLIDPTSTADDIAMPGHMFPLRAKDGGVLERRGQTEASVDMARLAGLTPAGVICEVMREDGEMMRLAELLEFAQRHHLPVVSVEQIAQWRREHESASALGDTPHPATATATATATASGSGSGSTPIEITEIGRSRLPTVHGEFQMVVFRDAQGLEHSALTMGAIDSSSQSVLTRVHSECLTGDAFGSLRCDCGEQLRAALARIAEAGTGVVLYLRQEGRGIGLGNKIRAYELQDEGADTVDANVALGFPEDAREYGVAAAMLSKLNVGQVSLLSNNPAKSAALTSAGIKVSERVPLEIEAQVHNRDYLKTKAARMGHTLSRTTP